MITIEREFRRLYKENDALNRRVANMEIPGRVAERKGKFVRLQFEEKDPRTGKAFLSPWVQVQESAAKNAGGVSSHHKIAIGERMRLSNPSGVIGLSSIAVRDGYTDEDDRPTDNEDEHVIAAFGKCQLSMTEAGIFAKSGDSHINITPEGIDTKGKSKHDGDMQILGSSLKHNTKEVGDSHKHTDVEPGVGLSGIPI